MPKFQKESELIKFLDRLDEEGADAVGRDDLERRIENGMQQVRGKQWKGNDIPNFLYNVIGSALEDKTGKLSESKPKINILASREGLGPASEVIKKCVSSLWDKRSVEYKTERIGYWGAVSGVSFVATPYNHRLENGTGDIDFVIKDPRSCVVDPSVVSPEDMDNGEYVIMEDCLPLDYIRSEYFGRGALVEADERSSGFERPGEKSALAKVRGAALRAFGKKKSAAVSAIPRAIIKEYYIKDRRLSIEDDGAVPICETITKYNIEPKSEPFPGGRRIIRAGEIILEDGWNPFWDGAPPVDVLSWKISLDSIWGPDEIEGVRRMQEAVNRLGDAYVKSAILNSVVRVVADYGALSPEERNKLSNEAGQIIETAPGRKLEYMVPTLLPIDVVNFVNQLHDWIRQKIGVSIPPTQKSLPSIATGPALDTLQLMVESPIRTAARRIEEFYTRIGQKLVSRVLQYYTSDRIIHLVGMDNKWVEFEYKRKEILMKADGSPRSESDLRKFYKDFRFTIEPGSSLAIAKAQKAMMLFQLSQAGMAAPYRVLDELGFSNPKEMMAEAQAAKQAGMIPDPAAQNGKGSGSQSLGQNGLVQ